MNVQFTTSSAHSEAEHSWTFPKSVGDLYLQLSMHAKNTPFEDFYSADLLKIQYTVDDYHSLYEIFAQIATQNPDSIAWWFWEKIINYRDLKMFVDQCAANYIGMGISPGSIVAIQLPNCIELLIAMLACHKIVIQYV